MKSGQYNLAIAASLAASFFYASQVIVQRLGVQAGISGTLLVLIALFAMGIVLLPITITNIRGIAPRAYPGLLLLAIVRIVTLVAYFQALDRLPASNAVLLFFLGPFFVQLQMAVLGYSHLRLVHFGIFILAISGLAIALQVQVFTSWQGVLWGVLAGFGLSWQYMMFQLAIPKGQTKAAFGVSGLLLTFILLIAALIKPDYWQAAISPTLWILSGWLMAVSLTAVLITLWIVRTIGSTNASLYGLTEPVFVILIATLAGWEDFGWHLVLGPTMVIGALGWLRLYKPPNDGKAQPTRKE